MTDQVGRITPLGQGATMTEQKRYTVTVEIPPTLKKNGACRGSCIFFGDVTNCCLMGLELPFGDIPMRPGPKCPRYPEKETHEVIHHRSTLRP